ncbi:MAG: hypothetical protein SGPRY_007973 [Prymnesium sp.]
MTEVKELVERVRGDFAKDPFELRSGPAVSTVRGRDKRRELSGNFRFGNMSETDRLTNVATNLARVEGPQRNSNIGSTITQLPTVDSSKWRNGNFQHPRIQHSVMSDTALMHDPRLPFISAPRSRAHLEEERRDVFQRRMAVVS